MTNHTPTTEQVRQAYAVAHETTGASMDECEFDRWLAAHNRKIAAEALRDAAGDMHRSWCQEDGPSDWLDIRADRIEQGGES